MRQLILLVAFAFVVGSGAAVVFAQDESQEEAAEVGAPSACATPVASPDTSPVGAELVETATPEIDEIMGTPIASPGASPVAEDACATPMGGTPPSS